MKSNRLPLQLDILAPGVNYWTADRRKAYAALARAIKKMDLTREKK